MIPLQRQARALGDPTRHRIFAYVVDAGRPVGVAELTDLLELNHNAIRQHLAKLVDAELLLETSAPPDGPGRPRLVYVANPAADSRWGAAGPYERLSRLLVEVIRTGDTARDVGRRAADGLRAPAPTGRAAPDLAAAMDRQGFEPEVRPGRARAEVVLAHCPFASAALADRRTVCELHLGIAEGLVEGTDMAVTELVAHDPRQAGCRVRLAATPVAPAALTLRGRTAR